MKKLLLVALMVGGFALGSASSANAGVAVGIGVGVPGPYPYYGYGYPYPYYGYVGPYWYGPGWYGWHGRRVFYNHPWRGARFRHWR